MSKYFDGYASFKYEDMSREKLIAELKEKVRYIGQLKREHSDEIAKTQSSKDKKISDLEAKLSDLQQEQIKEMQEHQEAMELADKTILNLIEDNRASQEWYKMQLAEKEKESLKYFNEYRAWKSKCELLEQDQTKILEINQDKISFAVDILEELADCSNYINSKLDFECGHYVSEKVIRDKIKILKGTENE